MTFDDCIGERVWLFFDKGFLGGEEDLLTATIIGSEAGGVWIESADWERGMPNDMREEFAKGGLMPVFFIPFHRIRFASRSRPHLDGLEEDRS